MAQVARSLGVHPSTVRRWVREAGDPAAPPVEPPAETAPAPPAETPVEPPAEPAPAPRHETPAEQSVEPAAELPVAGAVEVPDPTEPLPARVEPAADDPVEAGTVDPDRILPLVHRLRSTHRYVAVVVAWLAMLAVSALLPGPGALRGFLQFGHLLGLAVAVGAVAVIDWHGLLWMGRKRDLRETARIAAAVTPLIWAGLLVLGLTGAVLKPDLTAPLAWVKMVAVLFLALNGVAASETRQVLRRTADGVALVDLPRALAARLLASAAASQVAWLTAIVVGLTTQSARP